MSTSFGTSGPKQWQVYAGALVAAAALSGGAYVAGLRPLMDRRAANVALDQELETRGERARAMAASLEAGRRELAEAKDALECQPLRLKPADQINLRLAAVTRVAGECGMTIDEVQPGAPADSPHYQTVPLRMVGSGSYPACAEFLHALRAQFPDTAIRSFDSLNKNPAMDAPEATFRFELTWFAAPANAPAAAASALR
jgi:Tfp pilus assembly protein PilO